MQFVVHSCSIVPKTYCLERHLEENLTRAVTVFHPNLTLRTVKFVYYFNVMLIQLQINFLGEMKLLCIMYHIIIHLFRYVKLPVTGCLSCMILIFDFYTIEELTKKKTKLSLKSWCLCTLNGY